MPGANLAIGKLNPEKENVHMRNRPTPAVYRRSDDPAQIASAIKHYEKQLQNRHTRQRLAKLRERLAKLNPQPAVAAEAVS